MTYRRSAVTTGTFAGRPTSAPDGSIYMCTDGPLQFIMTGGAWKPYLGSIPLVATPAANTFSTINCTVGSSFKDWRGGLLFDGDCNAGTMMVAKKTAPGTPYTVTTHLLPTWTYTLGNPSSYNFCTAGIAWRESSTGNLHTFGIVHATSVTGIYCGVFRSLPASGTGSSGITYSNGTDFNFPPLLHSASNHGVWLRVTDDGTNRIVSFSHDGSVFKTFVSTSRTSSITPDEVGLYVGSFATGNTMNPSTFFTSYAIT